MKRARLLLISLFNFCILVAQPTYQIKHYSVNDGMSQGIVQTIIQDKKGFLWFGTWNGLNKFDGYTFKNYKTSYQRRLYSEYQPDQSDSGNEIWGYLVPSL